MPCAFKSACRLKSEMVSKLGGKYSIWNIYIPWGIFHLEYHYSILGNSCTIQPIVQHFKKQSIFMLDKGKSDKKGTSTTEVP